ncbi:MAG: hypothetical protein MRY83_22530, partial [Flavobacteriales bacterium]|nr:hypothetical protein [Flavobacteriales bacterium]
SVFEKMLVNGFGLPFNSGVYVYIILVVGLISWLIYFTRQKGHIAANTIITCVSVILIGYSSFAIIMIRSSANPPMDENNPENVFALLSYLNREQYGDRPLFYGQQFNSPLDNRKPYADGKPVWFQDKKTGKYIISDDKKESVPNYAEEFQTLFPRMYSPDKKHVREYKSWTDFKGKRKRYKTVQGEVKQIPFPTFGENIKFFVNYQIGWMYMRYFMWNFAGRQNDIQGHGNNFDGNWISGIPFLDNARLGDQDNLPANLKDNPARNKFYLLPLLLGIIGLVYQFSKHGKDATVVMLLFFFTGLAIVIYLNQYPIQPRERDYAYAGSFYAYAIWIGLGVYALFDWTRKTLSPQISAIAMSLVSFAAVPMLMGMEGWDDHDRSNTYTARDFAKNYLQSCAPNAVLFTNGDNDTFPLWYVQEVEEFRTDVRVINLSLLNTDWYIDQMRRKAYDSEKVPFNMPPEKYRQGTRDFVYIFEKGKSDVHLDIKEAMDFITDDSKGQRLRNGQTVPYFPTKNFSLKVDSAQMIANGTVKPENAGKMVDRVKWKFPGNHVMKNDMMIFDLIANNNWERPVYFAITTGNRAYVGLQNHFQLEGLAYRLVPISTPKGADGQIGLIDTDIMYDNIMNKFQWGGMEKYDIYLNENNRRMCMNLRNNFARLAKALSDKGEKEKAVEVLDKCMEVMPENNVPYNFFMIPVIQAYISAGATEKVAPIVEKLYAQYEEEMDYYLALDNDHYKSISKSKAQQAISILYQLNEIAKRQNFDFQPELDSSFNDMQLRYGEKEQSKGRG